MFVWSHLALPAFAEIVFLSAVLFCVYKAQKQRIYPAFWQLLIFLVISNAIILVDMVLFGMYLISAAHTYSIYFYTYWLSFGIESILVIRVLHEMFRHAMRSVPGVQKLGRPIFFWAVVVSVVLASASGMSSHGSAMSLLLASTQVLARSQSVLALCLVAFLAFASDALGVPFSSRIFGVTFGLGLMATGNLLSSAIMYKFPGLSGAAGIGLEVVYVASFSIWGVYFLRPEPARRLVAMPVTSPLMRWNEIAQTLGNPAGQVAVSYPPSFMTDVFDLVNNVMGPADQPHEVSVARSTGPIAS